MKKFITMLLALSMMLGFTFVVSMSALEVEENPAIEIANETLTPTAPEESEELQPMAAYSCGEIYFHTTPFKNMAAAIDYFEVRESDVRRGNAVHFQVTYHYYIQKSGCRVYFNIIEGGWT